MKIRKIATYAPWILFAAFLAAHQMTSAFVHPQTHTDVQIKLLEAHNEQRASKGYEPLEISSELCEYAQSHAEHMAKQGSLRHSKMSDLAKVLGSGTVGENIAWGQEDVKEVVDAWMWSPGHRWNILGGSYKKAGFGVKEDKDGRKYWCVVFSS